MTTEKTDINEAAIGANASAEEATDEGGAEASVQKGVDIVLANRLVQTAYSKKDFRTYIKVRIIMRRQWSGIIHEITENCVYISTIGDFYLLRTVYWL